MDFEIVYGVGLTDKCQRSGVEGLNLRVGGSIFLVSGLGLGTWGSGLRV